jgi:hypothetical protein
LSSSTEPAEELARRGGGAEETSDWGGRKESTNEFKREV